jgi:hypothetical protein
MASLSGDESMPVVPYESGDEDTSFFFVKPRSKHFVDQTKMKSQIGDLYHAVYT